MKSALPLLLAALLAPGARAGEPAAPAPSLTPAEPDSGWEFLANLYVPMMGLEGDIGVAGMAPTAVDIGFDDLLDNFDGSLSGAFEARNGRWSITADAIWLKVSFSTPPITNSYLAVTQNQIMGSLVIGYDLYQSEDTRFEVVAGAAINSLEVDMDLFTPRLPVTIRSGSGSQSWIDPVVGLRVRHRLGDRWGLFAGGTFGSFDVSSDEYWQIIAGISYRLSESTSLALAYRMLSVDYQQGGFLWDTQTSGPNVGLVFQF
jgi:hypothetical protein